MSLSWRLKHLPKEVKDDFIQLHNEALEAFDLFLKSFDKIASDKHFEKVTLLKEKYPFVGSHSIFDIKHILDNQ